MAIRLRRREKARKELKKQSSSQVWIFTEGDVTEPEYFEDWKTEFLTNKKASLLKIEKSESRSDPDSVYKKAEKRLKTSQKKDFVFIVIDEDERGRVSATKNKLDDILQKCKPWEGIKKEKVNCIFSNRSFEFWGLLHFCNSPSNAPLTKKDLKEAIQKYLTKYTLRNKRFDFSLMKDKISHAKTCAKKIRALHHKEGDIVYTYKTCSTTNVDELMDFLENFFNLQDNNK